jgi:uncharacterized membrane protein YeaQ/YmgE (transglycosylase-associated protein family)
MIGLHRTRRTIMAEHVAQMGPMLILAGLAAGWMAEAVARARGYGLLPDMVLGVIGSVGGGGIVWFVVSGEAGMVTMFLIGCAAAALVISAQRSFWRSARLGT